jgi:hypothetical protein
VEGGQRLVLTRSLPQDGCSEGERRGANHGHERPDATAHSGESYGTQQDIKKHRQSGK